MRNGKPKISLVCIAFIGLFILQPSYIFAEVGLSEILDGILKRYGNLPGFVVPYERDIVTRSMALLGEQMKSDLASGNIFFRPKNFLKLQQEKPILETVTTDGETLWIYTPEKKQVYQYSAKSLGKGLKLLTDIFYGLQDVTENFDIMLSEIDNKKEYKLQLVPNPPLEQIEHMDILVSQKDYSFLMLKRYDFTGTITTFVLGDLIVQEKLDEEFFRFVAPEGVEVIKE